ncbi:uncharacterized protein LOC110349927 [Heterocephalus glaber]|uniref:Uncharacterized protein LOC110349927 n=1 Tax=Heterocephalus glaber TaxID=10181 RepID=A0AAX6T526_HETGA|nr:uncharacterized protein LOC110349927 [Heterocephalus glaber]XP_021116544.1 uncharacterized protein LOC110349927 [Heterocephalus glaber]
MVRVAPALRREAAIPCFFAFLLCLSTVLTWTEMMGQTVTTPLSLLTGHFGEVRKRAHNLNLEIKKRKLITLCRSEWPTFKVNWPPEGTFDLETVKRVREVGFCPRMGHPDQEPYIVIWEDLVQNPPSWIKPFLPPQKQPPAAVLAVHKRTTRRDCQRREIDSKATAPLYPVLQGGTEEDLLFPPLYCPHPAPPLPPPTLGAEGRAPTGSAIRAEGGALAGEEGRAPMAAEGRALTIAGEEIHTRAGIARGDGPAPNTRSLHTASPVVGPTDSTVLPLRATGPPDEHGNQPLQYWPFATSDLYNWRTQHAKFSDNPRDLIQLLETVLFTHQPT